MRLIKPFCEWIEQPSGLDGVYKQIEIASRTCYKSEDKITEGSAKAFVDRMIKSGHGAMLEHGTVYLAMPMETILPIEANGWGKYTKNPYSKGFKVCEVDGQKKVAVTTNLRVLVEKGWFDDLEYFCEPTEYHEKRVTIKFALDRVTGESFIRHRVFSFARESTRYCNYSKDKFGNEITLIIPEWCPEIKEGSTKGWDPCSMYDKLYLQLLQNAEDTYFALLKQWDEKVPDKRYKSGFKNNPWTPQQARVVLPFSICSPLVMTGFVSDWKHFFDLRCDPAAHPQARELAIPLREEFIKRGLLTV